ncbi:eukaryotic initiation factor 4A [Impatiens glandulifera]|uniref:eukaryotic initiation factor 4A n=1 Tax=Impatiens glandulifera TaxID=253017 RepID=UPI001FB07A59|nr:eukaryotic initiation factor 4A [Impatiens glandulifera]
MAIEAVESLSPVSQSHTSYRQPHHFYLPVDRLQFKEGTLVDLLRTIGRLPLLPIVVCCSTRDVLDAVSYAVANLSHISTASLYSDLSLAERASVLENFREATMKWNQMGTIRSEGDSEETVTIEEQKSHMIVVTDACLPLITCGESPITARLLINYELPTKKETYMRRMTTCLAADGIVINMLVEGEMMTLKGIEQSSGLVISEMPINILEML